MDGLRHDIRIAVALQHPSNLDTAYTLALLQEEMADSAKKSEFHAYEHGASFKNLRAQVPAARHPQAAVAGDKVAAKPEAPLGDDKLTTLKSYHRARGLCDICAEKWFRGHKCPPTMTLHAMQEVLDLFHQDEQCSEEPDDQESPVVAPEQLFLALSVDALHGSPGRQTIQFQGQVQG